MSLIDTSPFDDFGWGPFWTAFWNAQWRTWAAAGWAVPLAALCRGEPQIALTMMLLYLATILIIRR